jgi:hypothetical protein
VRVRFFGRMVVNFKGLFRKGGRMDSESSLMSLAIKHRGFGIMVLRLRVIMILVRSLIRLRRMNMYFNNNIHRFMVEIEKIQINSNINKNIKNINWSEMEIFNFDNR